MELDDRFFCFPSKPTRMVDTDKIDYIYRPKTEWQKFMEKHGDKVSDITKDIIFIYMHKESNNDFKRKAKRYYGERRKKNKDSVNELPAKHAISAT